MNKRHRNEHEVDLEACADALYKLLSKRASSYDALDVEVTVNDGHVDAEMSFSAGPDIGVTIDVALGTAQFCTLVGENDEVWSEEPLTGLTLIGVSEEQLTESLKHVVRGMLDLRRPDGPASAPITPDEPEAETHVEDE
ncbi:MAG: hypothetical protein H7123_07360 [Thermoleophilia bacterium]|nr:hypothetical protein [Thermoleophilia bacterium]